MRYVAVIADVVMGLILGLFLYAALSRMWEGMTGPAVLIAMLAAGVLVVLFRRPNGSLAPRGPR